MIDMHYQKKRETMVSRLREMGIVDNTVLQAMARVPRHQFIAEAFSHQAYDEKALPIGYGQTISHPYTVARMTEELNVNPGDKILEIGTGSGYQAAILAELKAQLFTIEIKKPLSDKARLIMDTLGYRAAIRCGDG
ncbi:MAG: protein-L-isoaspartate O-methyltransferase, partial [Calditrichales bacterium]